MTAQTGQILREDTPLGLYLHVPFCAKECEFCAFYKEKADRKKIEVYLDTIEMELEKFAPHKEVSTIFFGGGTPTLLTAKDLERLCSTVSRFAYKGPRPVSLEWTVECAPNTLTAEKLEVMQRHGVNRFSLGVQSFNERTLNAIGRPHTMKQTQAAIELLRNNVENWNIDLIFAAADSQLDQWRGDLEQALALEPKHISTYCLTLESDTELYLKMLRGQKKRATPEEEGRFYLETWKILRGAGMEHYEVANFARAGWACRHNLNTWHMHEWQGYGPSASSQVSPKSSVLRSDTFWGAPGLPTTNAAAQIVTERFTNIPDLEQWSQGLREETPKRVQEEKLTTQQMAVDAVVFGLRLLKGVDLAEVDRRWGAHLQARLASIGDRLAAEGLLEQKGPQWRLTDAGLLVADAVGGEILTLAD